MRKALRLALRGQGRVEPNPMVGCVLVRSGRIVGEGFHRRFGGAHAEVEALGAAGAAARGATAFVTLEPCCHFGKTPPCTDALIAGGVKRVVAAMRDPFPAVNGGGFRDLRRGGIGVEHGLLEADARELNAPFITRVTQNRPYVILKWAQSLDGKIATRTGDSQWISGEPARRLVHRVRGRVDGILVGIGTVLADDPLLTARDVALRRVARRVVLDSRLRTPLDSQLVRTAKTVPTIIFASAGRPRQAARLLAAGVNVIHTPSESRSVPLRFVLNWMAEAGWTNLLVEGGAGVLTSFLEEGLTDEGMVFVSPRLIGGREAVSIPGGPGVSLIKDAPRFDRWAIQRVGSDVLYRIRFSS